MAVMETGLPWEALSGADTLPCDNPVVQVMAYEDVGV